LIGLLVIILRFYVGRYDEFMVSFASTIILLWCDC